MPQGVGGDVEGALPHMDESARQLDRGAPGRAGDGARQAADRLDAARKRMADARRGDDEGSADARGRRDEPIKIPGADDSAAPRAFREELLDAMKRGAPRRFEDQVRRFYEELVR